MACQTGKKGDNTLSSKRNANGLSTNSSIFFFQMTAFRLNPAPGNQLGKYFTRHYTSGERVPQAACADVHGGKMSTGQRPPPDAIRLASNERHSSASFRKTSSVDLTWYPYTTKSVNPPAYLITWSRLHQLTSKKTKNSAPSEVVLKPEWIFKKASEERLRFKPEQWLVVYDTGRSERSLHQLPLAARLIAVWGKRHHIVASTADRETGSRVEKK